MLLPGFLFPSSHKCVVFCSLLAGPYQIHGRQPGHVHGIVRPLCWDVIGPTLSIRSMCGKGSQVLSVLTSMPLS